MCLLHFKHKEEEEVNSIYSNKVKSELKRKRKNLRNTHERSKQRSRSIMMIITQKSNVQ